MRLSQNLILIPVFAQVLLTYAVLFWMGSKRFRSGKDRGQSAQDLALATDADWSMEARQAANNFRNQFELPVLFYTCCAFTLITRQADVMMFALAASFVVTRIAHAAEHLTTNVVMRRGTAYLVGAFLLLVMWILLVWRVMAAGW